MSGRQIHFAFSLSRNLSYICLWKWYRPPCELKRPPHERRRETRNSNIGSTVIKAISIPRQLKRTAEWAGHLAVPGTNNTVTALQSPTRGNNSPKLPPFSEGQSRKVMVNTGMIRFKGSLYTYGHLGGPKNTLQFGSFLKAREGYIFFFDFHSPFEVLVLSLRKVLLRYQYTMNSTFLFHVFFSPFSLKMHKCSTETKGIKIDLAKINIQTGVLPKPLI